MTNNFLWSLINSLHICSHLKYLHAFTQHLLFFFKSKYCLYKKQKKKKNVCEDPRNLEARDRGLSDYYSESSILESRVHGDESPILLTLTILDRRAKWLQRIPFSRSTVVTFGGPKFLTLQITSTRKRKSAVYFVCWQSRTSPSLLIVRVRCWWSAVERFIEPFPPPSSPPLLPPIRFYCTHNYFCKPKSSVSSRLWILTIKTAFYFVFAFPIKRILYIWGIRIMSKVVSLVNL